METNDLRVFIEVARLGSFAAAARSLNYSASGVCKLVDVLEERLGTKLFERNTKGIVLTPQGAEILQDAEHVMESVESLQRKAALMGEGGSEPPVLNIGVSASSLSRMIAGSRFGRRLPAAQSDTRRGFVSCSPGDGLLALDAGLLDALLFEAFEGERHLARYDDMRVQKIAQVPLTAVVSKTSELAGREFISLNALRSERFVSSTNDGLFKLALSEKCRQRGFAPRLLDEPALHEGDAWRLIASNRAVTLVYPWPGCEEDLPFCAFVPLHQEPDLFLDLLLVCKKEKLCKGLLDLAAFLKHEYGAASERWGDGKQGGKPEASGAQGDGKAGERPVPQGAKDVDPRKEPGHQPC